MYHLNYPVLFNFFIFGVSPTLFRAVHVLPVAGALLFLVLCDNLSRLLALFLFLVALVGAARLSLMRVTHQALLPAVRDVLVIGLVL